MVYSGLRKGGVYAMAMTQKLTLNLEKRDLDSLRWLSGKMGKNQTDVLREALRMLHRIQFRLEGGEKVFSEDPDGNRTRLDVD